MVGLFDSQSIRELKPCLTDQLPRPRRRACSIYNQIFPVNCVLNIDMCFVCFRDSFLRKREVHISMLNVYYVILNLCVTLWGGNDYWQAHVQVQVNAQPSPKLNKKGIWDHLGQFWAHFESILWPTRKKLEIFQGWFHPFFCPKLAPKGSYYCMLWALMGLKQP